MFSPTSSLTALRVFARELMLENRCAPIAGRCVWTNLRRTPRAIEKQFAIAVAPDGPRTHASDSYICMGASSLGSGRSVFVDGFQVKGVGRTAHAPPYKNPRVSDGWLALDRAVRELHGEAIVRRWWSLGTIPLAFAIVLPRGPLAGGDRRGIDRVLLGRRGSPIRIGHLHYLRGASYIQPMYTRLGRWRRFANQLAGVPGTALDLDRLHALLDAIVDRALVAVAESRLLGLTAANWHDNADVFARAFDCEDIDYHFGAPLEPGTAFVRPGESPRTYFTRNEWATVKNLKHDVFASSLQYLQNAFVALDHLGAGLTYDPRRLDARYGWAYLRRGYRAAQTQVAQRVFGRDVALPLVAGPKARPLDVRPFAPAALAHALDGARLTRERDALVAEAIAIGERGGDVAAYRRLFATISR